MSWIESKFSENHRSININILRENQPYLPMNGDQKLSFFHSAKKYAVSGMIVIAFIMLFTVYSSFTALSTASPTSEDFTLSDDEIDSTKTNIGHGSVNVIGTKLIECSLNPVTGFYRDGFCETGTSDTGTHTVCAKVTDKFLKFSKTQGNDLITPYPDYDFPGLKDGDKWCLCSIRWLEAEKNNAAPPLYLAATHIKTLKIVSLDILEKYALDTK